METYTQGSSRQEKFIQRYQERFSLVLDKDWSMRECRLRILKMFLDGSIYDQLTSFNIEYTGGGAIGVNAGQYIPLSQRRPSVLYRIPKIIVDESVSMLFGEDHFPKAYCEHDETNEFLDYINEDCGLHYAMIDAAKIGSLGSVCIIVKVLEGKFYFEVLGTRRLTPVFDQKNPGVLVKLTEKRKIDGATLISQGYPGIDSEEKNKFFYVVREWTKTEEIYYKPYLVEEEENQETFKPKRDNENSSVHDLGFLPAVWIKNTPNCHHIDGDCTFEAALDISIEIDYQLSQLGRLLKYNSDPTLVIKNPSSLEGTQLIKSIGALNLDEKGDAYLLEMSNASTTAVIDYVRCLREFALESVRGNRANPDKLSAVHSGKALQMLNSSLIALVCEMRITYGEFGLIKIYRMILDIYFSGKFDIETEGHIPSSEDCARHIELKWPEFYTPTPQDKLQEQQALTGYTTAGILSLETARANIQDKYGILDVVEESTKVDSDNQKALESDQAMQESKNAGKAKSKPMESGKSSGVDRG